MGCGASLDRESCHPTTGPQARLKQPLEVDTISAQGVQGKSDTAVGPAASVPSLRSIPESVADVCPGPSDRAVAGTAAGDLLPSLKHEDSGVSDHLQRSIEMLSDALFGLPFSVSVAIPSIADTPLIGISDGFCQLTGYSRQEIVGQNCRFLLKGVPEDEVSETVRQEARRYCRAAHLRNLAALGHTFLLQRNSRKNGELFWNFFMLTMAPGPDKARFIIGLQLDLGDSLPSQAGDGPPDDVLRSHREHLQIVQKVMFGNRPENPLSSQADSALDSFVVCSDDIHSWLVHAEGLSESYQKWGTKPWTAWPSTSRHAMLDGGVTLLRLEAEERPDGAQGMSILAATKKGRYRSFKLRVEEVCARWGCKVERGVGLPAMGFTDISPWQMDEIGGLPSRLEMLRSFTLLRDGCATQRAETDGSPRQVEQRSDADSPLELAAGSLLECIWGKGFIKIEVDGCEAVSIQDFSITAPPSKPVYGVVDCCGAAFKLTLLT